MAKTKEFEVVKVNQAYADCSTWKSLVTATAWSNGEGFDLQITSMNGGIQHIAITFVEFDLLKKMVNKLESL